MQTLHELLEPVERSVTQSDRLRLLLVHLQRAAGLAAGMGERKLARVLVALGSATFYGDLSILKDASDKRTMLGAANKHLASRRESV